MKVKIIIFLMLFIILFSLHPDTKKNIRFNLIKKLLVLKKDMSDSSDYKAKIVDEVYCKEEDEFLIGLKFSERIKWIDDLGNKRKRYFIHFFMFKQDDWQNIKNKKIEFKTICNCYILDDFAWITENKIVYYKSINVFFVHKVKTDNDWLINIYDMLDRLIVSFIIKID